MRHRIGYIDGLRAVAVLLVVAHHAAACGGIAASSLAGRILVNGARGVELFFVLSGFCLAYPTLAKRAAGASAQLDVASYAAKRLVRILPPYWLAIVALVAFAALLTHFGRPLSPGMNPQSFGLPQIVRQWFLLFAGGSQALTDPFWTLPIEFGWYFLFPVLLWAWMRSPKIFGWSVFALFASGLFLRLFGSPLPYLPAFAVGIVAAEMRIRDIRLGILGPVALALFVALGVWTSYNGHWPQVWNPLWQFAAFFAVVCAGEFRLLTNALAIRVMTFLGVASYSIYLVHLPVLAVAGQLGANAVIAAVIGVAGGIAFWFVAERPFVETALRNRLVNPLTAAIRGLRQRPRLSLDA
jgi:peptidoglycan/LPS O-acetylase OafA/YrhL